MLTCKLCRAMIPAGPLPPGLPLDTEQRKGFEFLASVQAFSNHLVREHQDAAAALTGAANSYFMHLCASLATSSEPSFEDQREQARVICYWSLKGKIEIATPAPPKSPLVT